MASILVLLALIAMSYALPLTDADITTEAAQTNSVGDMPSPSWLNSVTYGLLCYDMIAMGILCFLWWSGHLKWMKEREPMVQRQEIDMWGMQRGERPGRQTLIEGEMRRMGMI
jgi:hypothetical protein